MKKALLVMAAVAMGASAFAQGTIIYANRNIPTLSGTGGGNGNGSYNVPIFQNGSTTAGAGALTGGVTVGLFTPDGNTLIGSSLLRSTTTPTDTSMFFAQSAQTFNVPGTNPGDTPTLIVREWQGSSFAAAKGGAGQWGEQPFTTRPLGGTPVGGGTPIPTPNMTGWGPESGAGIQLNPAVPEPTTVAFGVLGLGALVLARRRK
jgi:MYXO-CTERM domain-containing protein